MGRTSHPLLVLCADPELDRRVRHAAGIRFAHVPVTSWKALHAALRDAPPTTLVLVDPYLEQEMGGRPSPALRSLLHNFPSATVLAIMELRPERFEHLHLLNQWGVADVIAVHEEDLVSAIARRLRATQDRPLQQLLHRSLPPGTTAQAHTLLMAAAEVVSSGGRAVELARALYLSPRTLLRWCDRAELPPPRRLLVWLRLLLACGLLDDPGRTVFDVAHACGYASDNSLRRALQDFLRTTPTALRRQGALGCATRAFAADLATARHHPRLGARLDAPTAR